MEITINQENHSLKEACSIEQMLHEVLKATPKGIAVAINQIIVPKAKWPAYPLKDGDQVMLIKATQGG